MENEQTAEVQVFSPSMDLRDAWEKLKRSRIRVSSARSTRAGSIGHPCERFIFYERTAGDLRMAHGLETQALFDLGNELEPFVVRELEAMGFEVAQRQRDWFDRELEIGARADVLLRLPKWPSAVTAEIKGLNPTTAENIETIADIRDSRQPWVRKYYAQLQTYLFFDGKDLGVFVLLNKASGRIGFVDCPRDQPYIDELCAKAARIRDAVRTNEPPPRNESEDCGRCPFSHVCLPNRTYGPGIQILDSEEIEELIARRIELSETKSEIESIDKRLKKMLPEVPELLVGGYVVTARHVHREGYEVKEADYWKRNYAPLKTKGEVH